MSKWTPARKRAMLIAARNGKVFPTDSHQRDDEATWTILETLREFGWVEFVSGFSRPLTTRSHYELTESGRATMRAEGYAISEAFTTTEIVERVIALWDDEGGWIPGAARERLAAMLGVPVERVRTSQQLKEN